MSGGSHRGRPFARRTGFTLLEVLLAVALFAIALMMLASAYIGILQSLEAVKMDHALNEELRWLRERVLSEGDREALEKGGEVKTLDLGGVRWSVAIGPSNVADLFQVELNVELGDSEASRRRKSETMFVLRPSWSEAVERGKIIEGVKTQIEAGRREKGVQSSARPRARGGNR